MVSNQEILEKAIQKAIDNGWTGIDPTTEPHQPVMLYEYYYPIFNHEFAKAFWGEEKTPINWKAGNNKSWQVHLQQMVISPDPIKYLGENLD